MSTAQLQQFAPAELANEAIREVLRTQYDGVTALRLDSPPGAGKTGVVERLAMQGMVLLGERCQLVTQTNEQAFDLARRLAQHYPRYPFTLLVRRDLVLPDDLPALSNLRIARASHELPATGPCVVIANAARWSWIDDGGIAPFDCQIVDEAFQLPDYRFQQIAGMARRIVLVGDPGQIAPVITCEVERWRCDPAGPHVPCPRALVARHPDVLRLSLPVSRRLVPDTVEVIQPAFYPDMPFVALSLPGARSLTTVLTGTTPLDRAINLVERGASLVQLELPALIAGELDDELAETIVALIERLFKRRAEVRDDDGTRRLDPTMVGVVCAHVAQVNAVKERLPHHLADVFVETADRFQGLERPVMIVYHPLSGRADASEFHLDAGRLCVMLSRHRVACFIVTRGGIENLLLRHASSGERILGIEEDAEFGGWKAHLTVLQTLHQQGRVVGLR